MAAGKPVGHGGASGAVNHNLAMRLPPLSRWTALIVWALVAACAVFWASRVLVRAAGLPAGTSTVSSVQAPRGDVQRLLGAPALPQSPGAPDTAAPTPASARFSLLGVVAPRATQAAAEGVALIAVDGKPARAFRIGVTVDGDLVLQRVHALGADLGPREAALPTVSLRVAALPPPATGVPATSVRPAASPAFAPPATRPRPRPATLPGSGPADDAADATDEAAEPAGTAQDLDVLPGPGGRAGALNQ